MNLRYTILFALLKVFWGLNIQTINFLHSFTYQSIDPFDHPSHFSSIHPLIHFIHAFVSSSMPLIHPSCFTHFFSSSMPSLNVRLYYRWSCWYFVNLSRWIIVDMDQDKLVICSWSGLIMSHVLIKWTITFSSRYGNNRLVVAVFYNDNLFWYHWLSLFAYSQCFNCSCLITLNKQSRRMLMQYKHYRNSTSIELFQHRTLPYDQCIVQCSVF